MVKQPIRTCIGCRGKFPQQTLIRFACQAGRTVRLDRHKNLPGRGVYTCRSETCIERAFFQQRSGQKRSRYRLEGAKKEELL